jgi:hypothetical protein
MGRTGYGLSPEALPSKLGANRVNELSAAPTALGLSLLLPLVPSPDGLG